MKDKERQIAEVVSDSGLQKIEVVLSVWKDKSKLVIRERWRNSIEDDWLFNKRQIRLSKEQIESLMEPLTELFEKAEQIPALVEEFGSEDESPSEEL